MNSVNILQTVVFGILLWIFRDDILRLWLHLWPKIQDRWKRLGLHWYGKEMWFISCCIILALGAVILYVKYILGPINWHLPLWLWPVAALALLVHPKVRSKLKSFGLWLRRKPGSWSWKKIKAWSKWIWNKPITWLWVHKKEMRVWLTTSVLVGITAAYIAGFAILHSLRTLLSEGMSNWHASVWFWILLAILTLTMIVIEIVLWVLVRIGKFKTWTVLKVHGWIFLASALLVGLYSLLFVPWKSIFHWTGNETGGVWQWYSKTVPYPEWVLIGIIILLGLILLKIFGPKKAHASTGHTTTSSSGGHDGGHGSGPSVLGTALKVFLGLWIIIELITVYLETAKPKSWLAETGRLPEQSSPGLRHVQLVAKSGVETKFGVEYGMNLIWDATQSVDFRYNTEEKIYRYNPGEKLWLPPRVGPYDVWFTPRSKASGETVIDLYLMPIKR